MLCNEYSYVMQVAPKLAVKTVQNSVPFVQNSKALLPENLIDISVHSADQPRRQSFVKSVRYQSRDSNTSSDDATYYTFKTNELNSPWHDDFTQRLK